MQTAKEAVSNVAASAKSGMEKTKATLQEKADKMTAHDPVEKEIATQRKEERINEAEMNKQMTREHNAASKQQGGGIHSTALHPMSALPGHGTGEPHGRVEEGVMGSHPIGTNTGTGGTTARNPKAGGHTSNTLGTGGGYS